MPPWDPGLPWYVDAVVILMVVSMPLWVALVSRGLRRDVSEVRDQVKNTHDTNLRSDLDEARAEARAARESSHRTERYTADIARSVRAIEHSLDRRTALADQALADAVADRNQRIAQLRADLPRLIEEHLAQRGLSP